MLHTTFIISYFDPVQITITISYVFSILYHINVYRILLLMPASSVAIALALRKNRSLGKTFWFTVASVQEWMNYDNGDWICSIDLAPIVWSQLIEIRDNIAPTLRTQLREEYDEGYTDYQERIDKFLSLNAWQLSVEQQQEVKQNLVKAFPCLEELEDYLQVIIGRPVIIPAISEQLSEQQAECLQQITRFIEQYDTNLEQTLRESAIALMNIPKIR